MFHVCRFTGLVDPNGFFYDYNPCVYFKARAEGVQVLRHLGYGSGGFRGVSKVSLKPPAHLQST